MAKYLNTLRRQAGVRSLLSAVNSNPKIEKNNKLGVSTGVLHLAPGNMSGHEVCPKRSPGCSAACLHFAGSPAYLSGKTKARIARTKLLFADRNLFMNILALEIAEHIARATQENFEPALRLNGTSDIIWERKSFILWPQTIEILKESNVDTDLSARNLISLFPTTSFYDYTAIAGRTPGNNYHLTFSLKEQNVNDVMNEMQRGLNIAAVFPTKELPATLFGRPVIDGDEHDYRPADPTSVIVGLKAKGLKGKADLSGFIYRVIDTEKPDIYDVGVQSSDRLSVLGG